MDNAPDKNRPTDAAEVEIRQSRRPRTYSLRALFAIVTVVAVLASAVAAVKAGRPAYVFSLTFIMTAIAVRAVVAGQRKTGERLIAISFVLLMLAMMSAMGGNSFVNRRVMRSKYDLVQIGEALIMYQADQGMMPVQSVGGTKDHPYVSWRGALLTLIGRADLAQQLRLDEPWNGPNNRAIARAWIDLYEDHGTIGTPPMTSYLAVVGPHTAIPERGSSVETKISLDMIAKHCDPAKLIVVIEVPNSGVNWLEPRDLRVEDLKRTGLMGLIPPGGEPPHPEGFNVLFADGHVETLPPYFPTEELAKMLEFVPDSTRSE